MLLWLFCFFCFTVRLRCTGVNPDDHRVKSEIVMSFGYSFLFVDENDFSLAVFSQERLDVYKEKFQRCMDRSKGKHPVPY